MGRPIKLTPAGVFWIGYLVLLVMGVLLMSRADAAELPQAALKHRADLTRNARAVWGLEAPVATFASQVHQESRWRPDAVSPVGAQGIAQFMPTTADWIAKAYPALAERQIEVRRVEIKADKNSKNGGNKLKVADVENGKVVLK